MRIPIPKERAELLDIFHGYLCTSPETGKPTLKENAPEKAREAFDKYMKLIEADKQSTP